MMRLTVFPCIIFVLLLIKNADFQTADTSDASDFTELELESSQWLQEAYNIVNNYNLFSDEEKYVINLAKIDNLTYLVSSDGSSLYMDFELTVAASNCERNLTSSEDYENGDVSISNDRRKRASKSSKKSSSKNSKKGAKNSKACNPSKPASKTTTTLQGHIYESGVFVNMTYKDSAKGFKTEEFVYELEGSTS